MLLGCGSKKIDIPPGMTVYNGEGAQVNLKGLFANRFTLLFYGGIWDPSSREGLKAVKEIAGLYKGKGVRVIVIVEGESGLQDTLQFKKEGGYDFPFLYQNFELAKVVGTEEILPVIRLVGEDSTILEERKGFTNRRELELLIQKHQ